MHASLDGPLIVTDAVPPTRPPFTEVNTTCGAGTAVGGGAGVFVSGGGGTAVGGMVVAGVVVGGIGVSGWAGMGVGVTTTVTTAVTLIALVGTAEVGEGATAAVGPGGGVLVGATVVPPHATRNSPSATHARRIVITPLSHIVLHLSLDPFVRTWHEGEMLRVRG